MVLVILAILAAIMVPALLGYIDKAREKQYVLDARSVYMATQAYVDEQYAKKSIPKAGTALDATNAVPSIKKMADVDCDTITILAYADRKGGTANDDTTKAAIAAIKITGLGKTSSDNGKTATLNWDSTNSKADESGWVITDSTP